MRGEEKNNMINMIDDYVEHMRRFPRSIIGRIYGMFTLTTNTFAEVDYIIMENVYQPIHKINKKMEFDFKGNTRNRRLKLENKDR
jgi:hypothetical protein